MMKSTLAAATAGSPSAAVAKPASVSKPTLFDAPVSNNGARVR